MSRFDNFNPAANTAPAATDNFTQRQRQPKTKNPEPRTKNEEPSTPNSQTITKIAGLKPAMLVALGKGTDPESAEAWRSALITALQLPGCRDYDSGDWRLALDWEMGSGETGSHLPASETRGDERERIEPPVLEEALPPDPSVTPDQRLRRVRGALTPDGTVGRWLPESQRKVTLRHLNGEERDYFIELVERLTPEITATPALYAQDGGGDHAIVHLHYFVGGCDWWITELDPENGEAFGYACLNNDHLGAELGYVNLPDVFAAFPLVNLDYHWTPTTIGEIKHRLTGTPHPSDPSHPSSTAAPAATHLPASADDDAVRDYEAASEAETPRHLTADSPMLTAIRHIMGGTWPALDRVLDGDTENQPVRPESRQVPAPDPDRRILTISIAGEPELDRAILTVAMDPYQEEPTAPPSADYCLYPDGTFELTSFRNLGTEHELPEDAFTESITCWINETWAPALIKAGYAFPR